VLRSLLAALLVANLTFFAWSQGWLDSVIGVRSIGDREPERIARQVHPELVRVLPAGAAASAPSPQSTLACLEAGPFSDADVGAARAAVRGALPGADVTDVKADRPGAWIVYLGRYASREAMRKKEEELERRKLSYDEVLDNAALAPGLSLGRFEERVAAASALDRVAQQGIFTARVVELTPASSSRRLRIEQADTALVAQALALDLGALGKGFAACATP
jgi:hypothetical protein